MRDLAGPGLLVFCFPADFSPVISGILSPGVYVVCDHFLCIIVRSNLSQLLMISGQYIQSSLRRYFMTDAFDYFIYIYI